MLLESFVAASDALTGWLTLTAVLTTDGGLTDGVMRTVLKAASTPAVSGAPADDPSADSSWTDQLSAYSAAAAAAAAFLTLGVALLAAKYAAGQIAEARTTRREQAQPYVVLYAETSNVDPLAVEIVIKNYGTTAAYRVTLRLTPALRRSNFLEGPRREVVDVRIPHVIPILAPGQEYRTLWDHGRYRKGLSLPQEHRGSVTYDDSHGEHHASPVDLSWHQVHDRTLLQRYGPHHSAKALREISRILKGWGSHRHGLKVIARDGDAYDARQRAALEAWEEQQDLEAKEGEDQPGEAPAGAGDVDLEQSRQHGADAARRAQMRQIRAIARRPRRTGRR